MDELNFKVPYKIGTQVSRYDNGIKHIDEIYEYVIDRAGLSVILMLDINSNPSLSSMIDIKYFMKNWSLSNGKIHSFDKNIRPKTKTYKKNIIITKK